jgi:hypothetical protein
MEFDVEVKLAVYRHFADTGRRPSIMEMAEHVGSDAKSVLDAYRRLSAQRLLVLEADGSSIRMASPFSGIPTQHVVETDGIQYFANCAWDALGVLAALHKQGTTIPLARNLESPFIWTWIFKGRSHRTGPFTVLSPLPNGGTILSSPEKTCSSSGRRNKSESGVRHTKSLCVRL